MRPKGDTAHIGILIKPKYSLDINLSGRVASKATRQYEPLRSMFVVIANQLLLR